MITRSITALLFTLILPFAIGLNGPASAKDAHSYANVDAVTSSHLHLDVTVNFEKQALEGVAEYDIKRLTPDAGPMILDTRDMVIHKVEVQQLEGNWQITAFELAKADPILGSKLTVTLPLKAKKIRIHYATRPESSGLQWLTPAQTAGKKYPFLFTQSQPIHTRSWVPIQDTPAIRLTYSARIRTPENLLAVMSAPNNPDAERDGDYDFSMPYKIPPYLLALGVGDLHFKAMSENTGIYAEHYILEASAHEFADTYKMIMATEKLYGPYQWGRFDILMMPPSYPMGGMENPMLSFITPTVVAGDKSLVDLIAHELAHSWSGNLVTNGNWDDLWLNEGTTSYVENRIMEEIYGPERALMEMALSTQGLHRNMKNMSREETSLHVTLDDKDPDAAFTSVPYDKGKLFFLYLEQKFGRDIFDPFMKQYFTEHSFQSISSKLFIDYLKENLLKPHPGIVSLEKIEEWIYGTGMPADAPHPTSDVFTIVQDQQNDWLSGKITLKDIPTKDWAVHQWLHFITNLPADIPVKRLTELDKAFNLTQSRNNEIAHAWLLQGLKHNYQAILPRLKDYLPTIGRLKLIRPLYQQLTKTEEGKILALHIYRPARPGYHPQTQKVLDQILGLEDQY